MATAKSEKVVKLAPATHGEWKDIYPRYLCDFAIQRENKGPLNMKMRVLTE